MLGRFLLRANHRQPAGDAKRAHHRSRDYLLNIGAPVSEQRRDRLMAPVVYNLPPAVQLLWMYSRLPTGSDSLWVATRFTFRRGNCRFHVAMRAGFLRLRAISRSGLAPGKRLEIFAQVQAFGRVGDRNVGHFCAGNERRRVTDPFHQIIFGPHDS